MQRLSPASRAELARVEQALKVTDLLLQSGGFGLIALDLGDITVRNARRVPLTSWFRFRRAVENTATVLLVLEREAHARSCASLVLQLSAVGRHSAKTLLPRRHEGTEKRETGGRGSTRMDTDFKIKIKNQKSEIEDELLSLANDDATQPLSPVQEISHAELLTGLASHAEVTRGERKKPAGSVRAEFTSHSAWSA